MKGFIFRADTLKIKLGSVLTLVATEVDLNTSAQDNEEIVSFSSVGAEVKIGSLLLSGEGRNFAFLGNGKFVTKPGFGVAIGVGSANGESFKWPSWLPIKIKEIGIQWVDIQKDPADFVLTLSASVTGLKGVAGLTFDGAIEGVRIDVGALREGKFPIIDIAYKGDALDPDNRDFVAATLLRNRVNSGLSLTRNAGFASASAPLVFPLDADGFGGCPGQRQGPSSATRVAWSCLAAGH